MYASNKITIQISFQRSLIISNLTLLIQIYIYIYLIQMILADNPNRDELSTRHISDADIALNTWEYHDFIDALLDQKLSAAGLIKMKRLHHDVTLSMVATPILMFPLAWIANKWLQGWTKRGMASSRMNFFGMSVFYPVFLAWGFTRPLPRKLYTDVVADSGPDGTYIRESLKSYKPGLWSKISSQLNTLNFNFPEMHEFKGTTFPSNFVNFRTI